MHIADSICQKGKALCNSRYLYNCKEGGQTCHDIIYLKLTKIANLPLHFEFFFISKHSLKWGSAFKSVFVFGNKLTASKTTHIIPQKLKYNTSKFSNNYSCHQNQTVISKPSSTLVGFALHSLACVISKLPFLRCFSLVVVGFAYRFIDKILTIPTYF